MPKDKLTEYSATNASNTDVGGVNIDEGMLPSAVNNSIRELMTHLKNFSDGTDAIDALTSDGNILVGTTDTVPSNNGASGDAGVAISPDGVFRAARSGNVSLDINRMDSDGDIAAFRKDGSTVGSIGTNGGRPFFKNPTYGGLKVGTGYSVDPANNSTGAGWDNALDLGAGGTRWKDLYLSGGAYLGGTAAANALDDYEVGTWTPDIGGNSVVYSRDGRYVKVGDMVFANFQFALTTRGTGSQTTLSGLPYNSLATGQAQSGQISYFSNIGTACVFVGCYVTNNSSQILFTGGVSSATTITRNGFTVFADSCNIIGCAVYRAA